MVRLARFFALALALSLVGCGASESNRIQVGSPAPDFTLSDLTGKRVSLSDHRGRAVAVRFWSDWCAFCREEMTGIQEVIGELEEKGLDILAVNVGQDRERAARFMTSIGVSYGALLDEESEVAARFGVIGLPTSFFIDRKGIVRGKVLGEATTAQFVALAEKALQ